jgi:outer membrane protein assembly factor BamB
MLLGDPTHSAVAPVEAPRFGARVWTRRLLGPVIAPPAVDADGRSYWATQSGWLQALDWQGGELWRVDLGGASHSSPALLRDGSLVAATRQGEVWRIGPDGAPRWHVQLGREILSSPLLDEPAGRVVLSAEDTTVGLDLEDGGVGFWAEFHNQANNSSPAMGNDGLIRAVNWLGLAFALTGGGRKLWVTDLGVHSGFMSAPVLDKDNNLYTAGASRTLLSLDRRGKLRWTLPLAQPVSAFLGSTPEGLILVPMQGLLLAVNQDGLIAWAADLDGFVPSTSPAVSQDGVIHLGTARGELLSIDSQGRLRWTYELGGRFQAAPVLAQTPTGQPRLLAANLDGLVVCLE